MWQDKYLKNNYIYIVSVSFPIRSIVAIQRNDGGPLMHGVTVDSNAVDHNRSSYKVRVTMTDKLIICNSKHIQKTPIMTEQYLRQQIAKSTGYLTDIFTKAKQHI